MWERQRRGDQKQRELPAIVSVSSHLTPSWYQADDILRGTQNARGTHHQLANSTRFLLLRSKWHISSHMGGSICNWIRSRENGWMIPFLMMVSSRCPQLLLPLKVLPFGWKPGLTLACPHCCLLPNPRRGPVRASWTKTSHFPHCHSDNMEKIFFKKDNL